jgi:hypothetical protein
VVKAIIRRLKELFYPERCAKCQNPASGFTAAVTGKLLTKTADGKPQTKYYLQASEQKLCSKCLAEAISGG